MALPKNKKFTEEELLNLKNIRKDFSDISYKLGQIKMQRIQLDQDESLIVDELNKTLEKEKQTAKSLLDKYGKGTIDIDSGEFIPAS